MQRNENGKTGFGQFLYCNESTTFIVKRLIWKTPENKIKNDRRGQRKEGHPSCRSFAIEVVKEKSTGRKEDKDGPIPVALNVDGTWQKRGCTSNYGIVFLVSLDNGEL